MGWFRQPPPIHPQILSNYKYIQTPPRGPTGCKPPVLSKSQYFQSQCFDTIDMKLSKSIVVSKAQYRRFQLWAGQEC